MKRLLVILSLLWVAGTHADTVMVPPGVTVHVTNIHNGCLVAALEMEAALLVQKDLSRITWAKLVQTNGNKGGHAWCAYALLNGDIWAYDILHGSTNLQTKDQRIDTIVAELRRQRADIVINDGWFID